jgi:LuxR family maltose regulon positive regulatory protein
VHLALGKLDAALAWANERHLSAGDTLSYLHEFEHITLARVLLAQDAAPGVESPNDEATWLLGRLHAAAEEGHRAGSVIEIAVLQALDHHSRGDTSAALAALDEALTLAQPEGYVRVFLDEGPPMTVLLRAAAQRGGSREYARYLLAAGSAKARPAPARRGLVEPLSARELHVLRLLRSDLSGPDIARELTVSLNTVRTHTKSIYAKLGVNNRRAAVTKAEELDL